MTTNDIYREMILERAASIVSRNLPLGPRLANMVPIVTAPEIPKFKRNYQYTTERSVVDSERANGYIAPIRKVVPECMEESTIFTRGFECVWLYHEFKYGSLPEDVFNNKLDQTHKNCTDQL